MAKLLHPHPSPSGSGRGDRQGWRGRRLLLGAAFVMGVGLVVALLLVPGDPGKGGVTATKPDSGNPGDSAAPPAPAFELENLVEGGPRVALAAERGRPVVVNFWASWCVPCLKELPALQRVYEQVGERVAFIGINTKDSRRLGLALAQETGLTYPSGYDPANAVFDRYHLVGMPATIFISPDGRILARHNGELTQQQLLDTLERFFPASR